MQKSERTEQIDVLDTKITFAEREMEFDCEGNECTDSFTIDFQLGGDLYSLHINTKEVVAELGFDVALFKSGNRIATLKDCHQIMYSRFLRQQSRVWRHNHACEESELDRRACSKAVVA